MLSRDLLLWCAVLLSVLTLCPLARAAGVSAWELPAGAKANPDARGDWKPAAQGAAPAAGAAIDNGRILILVQPGAAGPILFTQNAEGKGTRVDLVFATGGRTAPVRGVAVVDVDEDEGTLRVSAGDCQADLTVQTREAFVKVRPLKVGGFVEVRARSRYAVLPDFFSYDVVYDPTRFQTNVLPVPAENFLLQFVEGNRAIVMCIWPGTLKGTKESGKKAVPEATAEGRDPVVDLLLEGEGPSRRVAGSRIELLDSPVYVAVLEHENLWFDLDVSGLPVQQPTRVDWKRPFNAQWRANMLVAEGKKSKDLMTRSQSYNFLYAPKPEDLKKRIPLDPDRGHRESWEQGYPVVYEERVYTYIYAAWFKDEDTYLALYADEPRKFAMSREKPPAPKPGEPAPGNIYSRALFYPLDRRADTPLAVHTPADMMLRTLGQGPCEYVLDLEGVRPRTAAGDKERKLVDNATCTIWRGHIFPIISRKPKTLPDEQKEHLVRSVQDLGVFLHAVNARIEEYHQWNEQFLKRLEQAKRNEKTRPVAERLGEIAEGMRNMLKKYNLDGFKKTVEQWDKTIAEVVRDIEAGNYESANKTGGTRVLGQAQDNAVSDCRRYVKAIRQEASFVETDDEEVRSFVADVRNLCQGILRNAHPKEMLHSDRAIR